MSMNLLLTGLSLLIGAASPIILAIIARKQTTIQAENRKANAVQVVAQVAAASDRAEIKEDLAASTRATHEKVESIHVAVNGERLEMLRKIEGLHIEITRLTVLVEKLHGRLRLQSVQRRSEKRRSA